ncbi:MAG TPA: 3-phosphoshikimate 1-carboxyvinyltransferase [Thermodesulfobium narugense]|nr:MAG: 3-phosphoshikimate 1-carboxyvinyltransferase [Thermodesulfobium narugense]HEM56300.1 3-phosphoshikimate 1-carboxyvinyltransferase [Thermodesulfobium narugense]
MKISGKLKKFSSEISVPSDKSITHRLFIFALSSKKESVIRNPLLGADTLSTLTIVEQLGGKVERQEKTIIIKGKGLRDFDEPTDILNCGNSGTTIRLFSGLLASERKGLFILTGDNSLRNRPMGRIIRPLSIMGANIFSRKNFLAPLAIVGNKSGLNGINYEMPISSAQLKSCLILAGLKANSDSIIVEPFPSRDHTELILSYLGINIKKINNSIYVYPSEDLNPFDLTVPGDPSSAAFFVVLAILIPGSKLLVREVCLNPLRIGYIEVLKRMGAKITLEYSSFSPEPIGNIFVEGTEKLTATNIFPEEVPKIIDEIPIISIAMALAEGKSEISGAFDLRKKESDRINAICFNLKNMGIKVTEKEDGFIVEGPNEIRSSNIKTFDDHRIAMAFTIAALLADGESQIDNPSCCSISFPDFYDKLKEL